MLATMNSIFPSATRARILLTLSGAARAVLKGHDSAVSSAAFSPDGTSIVTASLDETARIWDAKTGGTRAVLIGHDGGVYSAAFSPDGKVIVTASEDKTARLWDKSRFAPPTSAERIRLACDRLKEVGASTFTEQERQRPSLRLAGALDRVDPCNRQGLLSVAWWRKYFSWR
jgi:dipeptidyl aminopeptidase/acylaminoacyl peptidase